MAIRNFKPRKYPEDAALNRVIKGIYDDLNVIINAVNQYNNEKETMGRAGDIRVTEKGFQYRSKSGWKTLKGE